jgi:small subunit ribosomal protein S3
LSSLKNVIKDNYNMMLLKEYLKTAIKESGFSHVDISKTPTGTRVVLHVTRPGIVIGRKGTGIRELTEKLEKDFGLKSPQIAVNEITEPELTSSVMCNRLASLIERGTAFRRATMWTLQQIMNAGALGVQITVSGKLRGDRSSFEKHSAGILPRAGHKATLAVDEDNVHVPTPMGYIGVRIRIARKERYITDFELKGKEELAAQERRLAKEREEAEVKARTESEQIKIDAEKIEKLDLMEEIEEKLK